MNATQFSRKGIGKPSNPPTHHITHALLGEEGRERGLDSEKGQAAEGANHVGAAAGTRNGLRRAQGNHGRARALTTWGLRQANGNQRKGGGGHVGAAASTRRSTDKMQRARIGHGLVCPLSHSMLVMDWARYAFPTRKRG